ncbi:MULTISPECIES: phosphotransferase [Promicromonospora]|uniref:Phosphotransferase n=2 Tax=Promicromonospora TaxID=43676 RepID=A0ABW4UZR7_9MICO
MTTFIKTYQDPQVLEAAHRHHIWLSQLDSGVRIPALLDVTPDTLVFEHLTGPHPTPGDMPQVAQALGQLHTAASLRLRQARLDQPAAVTADLTITDFHGPRQGALALFPVSPDENVALYKDTNIRNVILTDEGPAVVDFDDLTLAPYGYDLAKLVVSTAMTHGRLLATLVEETLAAYNETTSAANPGECTEGAFRQYTAIHNHLTARYLHRNGYRHAWPEAQPWL